MLPACHCCSGFSMGQLRFPLWEPFVLEPTGPHEGTNYRDAQRDGGANLLPRCSGANYYLHSASDGATAPRTTTKDCTRVFSVKQKTSNKSLHSQHLMRRFLFPTGALVLIIMGKKKKAPSSQFEKRSLRVIPIIDTYGKS